MITGWGPFETVTATDDPYGWGPAVAGGVVPVTLLAYWVCNSGWTLAQSAVVARWFPTPGTAAAAARA